MSTEPEFTTAFEPHPLEGSSRFSLLGLLAGLNGVVSEQGAGECLDCEWCGHSGPPEEVTGGFACSSCHRLPPECTCYEHFGTGHQAGCPMRSFHARPVDDRELANTILGERVVDVMFGKTDPVRVTVSGERTTEGTK